jgi:ABC-type nitrate/sulfonate/bicarbonate transport system ATPase subunit
VKLTLFAIFPIIICAGRRLDRNDRLFFLRILTQSALRGVDDVSRTALDNCRNVRTEFLSTISVHDLSKTFSPRGAPRVTALQAVNIEIPQGEFLSVIGPSGCGKSTLLHILAGLEQPSSGQVLIDGRKILGPGPDRVVMFQEYGLYPWMTVKQNIEFGLKAKGLNRAERVELVKYFVNLVHLDGFEDRYPHEISGGMKQRVSLARAMAPDPKIVLMDEPFAALDSLTRDVMQEEILRIWNQLRRTFVLITHNIDEAIFLGDRVLIMTPHPGRVKEALSIDLPRPRDASLRAKDRQFLAYREYLASRLHEDRLRAPVAGAA